MNFKKNNFSEMKTVSIGIVEEKKVRRNGDAKLKISYRDFKGREYTAWTTWIRDDGHNPGDSIPVRNVSVPSFGLLNVPVSVNNHPQRYVEPFVAAMVLTGIGAAFAGYHIGKSKK